MSLIPGILALVLFGCLPVGQALAERVGRAFAIPFGIALIGLVVGFLLAMSAVMVLVARLIPQAGPPHEDRLAELGSRRAQAMTAQLVFMCILAGAAAALLAPDELPRVGTLLVILAYGVLPDAPLIRSIWPPELPAFAPGPGTSASADIPQGTETGQLATDEHVTRCYQWAYQDCLHADSVQARVGHEITLRLRHSEYEAFRNRTRRPVSDAMLAAFVLEGMTDEVRACTQRIATEAAARRLPRHEVVNFVLAFAREAFPYRSDEETHGQPEYVNYPIETLYEKECDCEDRAILAAAILVELGFDVGLVAVQGPDDGGHAALAVHSSLDVEGHYLQSNGRRYYYCEATPAGDWRFGEIPPEYLREGVRLTFVPIRSSIPVAQA